MPTTITGSFASAAAGNNADSSSRNSNREEGAGHAEWGRRANGLTQTFRRSSTTTTHANSAHHRDSSAVQAGPSSPSVGAYVPPHLNASRAAIDTRYSREQMLDLFAEQRDAGELDQGLDQLFVGDRVDGLPNGSPASKWSRKDDHKNDHVSGPESCWERTGATEPLALFDMTEEEKEIFSTSVNSPVPLKIAQQGGQHEGGHRSGVAGRKTSTSNLGTGGRPQNRRRDISESYPFPREALADPNVASNEMGTDTLDEEPEDTVTEMEREPSALASQAFGSLRRSGTNPLSAGLNGPSSPWSTAPSNQTMPPMGTFGNLGLANTKRSESRFRDLMSEDVAQEERGLAGLGKLDEISQEDQIQHNLGTGFGQRNAHFGSLNESNPQAGSRYPAFGTPSRRQTGEQGFGSFAQREQRAAFDPHQAFAGEASHDIDDPSSPTFTNPYASPQQQQARPEDSDSNRAPLAGLGTFQQEQARDPFAGRSGFDRPAPFGGQPFGSTRGFPSLGGLGGLPGLGGAADPWAPAPRSRTGTPTRERMAFGDTSESALRSPAVAFQSPGIGGPFSAGFGLGAPVTRGSRLGSLLPGAMQDQGREEYESQDESAGPIGPQRGTGSPFQGGRAKYGEYLGGSSRLNEDDQFREDQSKPSQPFHAPPGQPLSHQASFQQPQQSQQRSGSMSSATTNAPPTAQQKTMVMPDRIRWIYRDPQGNVQGPWSGLEMHDWYRAGFFSPELLVKKQEDDEYEPLAQLIRRIGNSREPFLVPQIGIPHAPSAQAPFPNPNPAASPSSLPPSAQPPFANSFPSFGTTLTADQQNALERRKQEEQTLMARQKEHLAYHQVLARQMGNQHAYPQQLHHHSSAQSLNSQPSYGSMTTPGGYQISPPNQQGAPGRFDNGFGGRGGIGAIGAGLDNLGRIREEDSPAMFGGLDLGRRQPSGRGPIGQPTFDDASTADERTAQMLTDRARLYHEQKQEELAQEAEDAQQQQSSNDRLQQFNELQNLQDDRARDGEESYVTQQLGTTKAEAYNDAQHMQDRDELAEASRELSLTEQVQQAASAHNSPAVAAWTKGVDAMPPQSSSPLPAPAARRGGPSLAEALAAETLPTSQSPSIETPTTTSSLAPWAREQQQEVQKGPSLKEIQEAEAKRAAKAEQIQAATRRAALEREMTLSQPPPPAPGLPSTSKWGEAPTAPSAATTVAWAKAAAAKTATASGPAKKTLQQIQQEEEAAAKRKKAQAVNNATMAGQIAGVAQAMSGSGGKRYADLAGQAAAAPPPNATGAWTTVGAKGKVNTPLATPVASVAPRAVSSSSAASAKPAKPATTASKTTLAAAKQQAQEEFKKWAIHELRPDLNKNIVVEDFVTTLLSFPSETEIITEVVHQNSRTMDSRHFAQEFVRRRGLADKGNVDAVAAQHSNENKANTGGWSEVARKGSTPTATKQELEQEFRVVAAKKKSGKK